MLKIKKILSISLALVLLATTSVTTVSAMDIEKKVINVNNSIGAPSTLHPQLVQGAHESWIIDQMYKGLFTKTPNGTIEPAICESYTVSDDGLTWTFKLRDFNWSSGNKGNANDFVTSIFYGLNPDNYARYMFMLFVIKNGESFSNGLVDKSEVGVKAINDKTLEITLEKPIPYFTDLLTNPYFYPIDSENANKFPQWYMSSDNYSSNGPFVLEEFNYGEDTVLIKNNKYYDNNKTKLDEIHFTSEQDRDKELLMYENGETNLITTYDSLIVEKLEKSHSDEIKFENALSTYYYYFNTEQKPLNNVKVRKALLMAIDREAITKNVLGLGERPAYTITPTGLTDENGNNYVDGLELSNKYNIEEAKKLLAEGLAEEKMNINDVNIKLLFNEGYTHRKITKAIKSMWFKNLGIKSTFEPVEFQELLDREKTGDF